MKAAVHCMLFLAASVLPLSTLAQESPNYQMKQHDLNAGGSPKDGIPLTSTHYEIKVSSLGSGLAVTGMASPAYRIAAGFPSTTGPAEACTLDCLAEVPPQGRVAQPLSFQSTATAVGCLGTPTFAWTFGDGGTSTQQNVTHAYAAAGTYAWSLVATADGQTCTKGGSVQVTSGIPGDCDGNGAVSIGEVQKAINMFLEVIPPDCGVDCNGNGTVSIGEVQKAINAFLEIQSEC
jgi:hypothetical protein